MQTSLGYCDLCKKRGTVIRDPRIVANAKTFLPSKQSKFERHLEAFKLCPACTYKLEVSINTKRRYRRRACRKTKCFVCETGDIMLLETRRNPGGFRRNFAKVFAKAKTVADSMICLQCLFGMSTWVEVKQSIYKTLGISNDDLKNNNCLRPRSSIVDLTLDESNSEMEVDNKPKISSHKIKFMSKLTLRSAKQLQNSREHTQSPILTKRNRTKPIIKSRTLTSKLALFRNLAPLNKTSKSKVFKKRIKSDKKLFSSLPYVDICADIDNIIKQTTTTKMDIVDISKETLTQTTTKMDIIDISKDDYFCEICDKSFSTQCTYQLHILKHENMDELVVNVKRIKLTKDGKLPIKKPILDHRFRELMAKYLGEDPKSASKTKGKRRNSIESSDSTEDMPPLRIERTDDENSKDAVKKINRDEESTSERDVETEENSNVLIEDENVDGNEEAEGKESNTIEKDTLILSEETISESTVSQINILEVETEQNESETSKEDKIVDITEEADEKENNSSESMCEKDTIIISDKTISESTVCQDNILEVETEQNESENSKEDKNVDITEEADEKENNSSESIWEKDTLIISDETISESTVNKDNILEVETEQNESENSKEDKSVDITEEKENDSSESIWEKDTVIISDETTSGSTVNQENILEVKPEQNESENSKKDQNVDITEEEEKKENNSSESTRNKDTLIDKTISEATVSQDNVSEVETEQNESENSKEDKIVDITEQAEEKENNNSESTSASEVQTKRNESEKSNIPIDKKNNESDGEAEEEENKSSESILEKDTITLPNEKISKSTITQDITEVETEQKNSENDEEAEENENNTSESLSKTKVVILSDKTISEPALTQKTIDVASSLEVTELEETNSLHSEEKTIIEDVPEKNVSSEPQRTESEEDYESSRKLKEQEVENSKSNEETEITIFENECEIREEIVINSTCEVQEADKDDRNNLGSIDLTEDSNSDKCLNAETVEETDKGDVEVVKEKTLEISDVLVSSAVEKEEKKVNDNSPIMTDEDLLNTLLTSDDDDDDDKVTKKRKREDSTTPDGNCTKRSKIK